MSAWKLLTGRDGESIAIDLDRVAWIKAASHMASGSLVYFDFCRSDSLVYVEVREYPSAIVNEA
jgi:hypothetical protein